MFSVEYNRNGQTRSTQYNRIDLARRFADAIALTADNERVDVYNNNTGNCVYTVDRQAIIVVPGCRS